MLICHCKNSDLARLSFFFEFFAWFHIVCDRYTPKHVVTIISYRMIVNRGSEMMATIFQLQNMKRKCWQWELANLQMEATIDKCLAFCQALVSSNQKFTFTLSIGKETFKFDNKELVASSCGKTLKKKSPSQIRREDRRREARKSKITEEVVKDPAVSAPKTPSVGYWSHS